MVALTAKISPQIARGGLLMLQPQNQTQKCDHLFTNIDTGRIKTPRFRRDFVWSKEQTTRLLKVYGIIE